MVITLLASQSSAGASANTPVGDALYKDIERLELKGLVTSGLLSTRPFNRAEAKRLIDEALKNWEELPEEEKERRSEDGLLLLRLEKILTPAGHGAQHIKPFAIDSLTIDPLKNAALGVFYGNTDLSYPGVNNNGDSFKEGFNLRASFSMEANAFDVFSAYLEPRLSLDEDEKNSDLLYGYAIMNAGNLEVEAGRDSMWWGSSYHGALIMTNNARPFDMVKLSSSRPFKLPWIFGYLGALRPTWFLTELEEDRDFPNARLMGMRLDFKATERFQFGLSRVFMFGGDGRKALSASDWFNLFIASDSAEHSDSPTNGNQIVSIDASYVYHNGNKNIPFSGIKLYTEWGAEDSSGDTKTPTGRANIYGALIYEPMWLRNTDIRIEWANTARNLRYAEAWYAHFLYTTGYKYEGDIIGHHMGTDARDIFVRVEHHFADGSLIGVEADSETSGIHAAESKTNWFGVDGELPLNQDINIAGGAGFEDREGSQDDGDGFFMWLTANLAF